jgi:methyltransferase
VSRRYLAIVALAAAARAAELVISRRHERRSRGQAAAPATYPLMVAAHVALFALPPLEAIWRRRRPRRQGVWVGLLAAATGLRWWSIWTLGPSWNVRAVVPPDLRPIAAGPYRFVRHPNYLAVVLEFAALPLAGGAWASAIALSALNAVVLWDRVRAEERLLGAVPGYQELMGKRARFIPGVF